MSGTRKEEESRKPYVFALAMASISLGVLGLITIAWRLLAYRPWWSEYVARNVTCLLGIVGISAGCFALAGISKRIAFIAVTVALSPFILILCSYLLILLPRSRALGYSVQRFSVLFTAALFLIVLLAMTTSTWRSWYKGRFRSGTLATLGMIIGTVLLVLWWAETCAPVSRALACVSNLKRLGDAMKVYAEDNHGHYPDPNQWCDQLLLHTDIGMESFLCDDARWKWRRQVLPWPIPENKRCYFAMNPDCAPNSPEDTVLLFEIPGGWNISGGAELLTAENRFWHGYILLNNGQLRPMKPEEFDWGNQKSVDNSDL